MSVTRLDPKAAFFFSFIPIYQALGQSSRDKRVGGREVSQWTWDSEKEGASLLGLFRHSPHCHPPPLCVPADIPGHRQSAPLKRRVPRALPS